MSKCYRRTSSSEEGLVKYELRVLYFWTDAPHSCLYALKRFSERGYEPSQGRIERFENYVQRASRACRYNLLVVQPPPR